MKPWMFTVLSLSTATVVACGGRGDGFDRGDGDPTLDEAGVPSSDEDEGWDPPPRGETGTKNRGAVDAGQSGQAEDTGEGQQASGAPGATPGAGGASTGAGVTTVVSLIQNTAKP